MVLSLLPCSHFTLLMYRLSPKKLFFLPAHISMEQCAAARQTTPRINHCQHVCHYIRLICKSSGVYWVVHQFFACLHKFQNDVVILRLIRSNASVVDPTRNQYALWNYTWDCHVAPIRAGPEIYFIMKEAEAYSLSRYKQENEVWKYGDKPEPPRAATSAEIAERTRINRAAGVFVENFNRRATEEARSQGIQLPSPMVRGSESMVGINVDPNEWDPQLFIHCQY